MKVILAQFSLLIFLCYLYQIDCKKTFRLCMGKHKQRRGPYGDNSLKQKSLYVYKDNNVHMVNYLLDWEFIEWEKIKEVFLKVDRRDFIYHKPYEDIPKHLGYLSWASSPHTVAKILDLCYLNLHRGAKILEIGSGSGYLLTLMAYLVGPTGHVTGLEHMLPVCIESIANITVNNYMLLANETIDILHKDGRNGHAEGGPYDCIIASCAFPEWPTHIQKQLRFQGRMVVPIGREGDVQRVMVYQQLGRGSSHMFQAFRTSVEPCVDEDFQLKKWERAQEFEMFHFNTPNMY